jgi:PKHD-type hydroxylase
MQYTIYEGNDLGHYDWHLDAGNTSIPPRKLSFILQLSDPDSYEGGDLQIMNSTEPTTVKKEKGFAVVFPSYTLHRVTPVTKGIRKTLVIWVTGPTFR